MSDTSTASVEVLDVTVLPGRGRLQGLAMVEVTLDGVAIILQGVRILRRADGLSYVEPPCCRHTDGDMVPAVVLPIELEEAVARAVLERAGGTASPMSGHQANDKAGSTMSRARARNIPGLRKS